jgi:hypothetical protein
MQDYSALIKLGRFYTWIGIVTGTFAGITLLILGAWKGPPWMIGVGVFLALSSWLNFYLARRFSGYAAFLGGFWIFELLLAWLR